MTAGWSGRSPECSFRSPVTLSPYERGRLLHPGFGRRAPPVMQDPAQRMLLVEPAGIGVLRILGFGTGVAFDCAQRLIHYLDREIDLLTGNHQRRDDAEIDSAKTVGEVHTAAAAAEHETVHNRRSTLRIRAKEIEADHQPLSANVG